MNNSGRRSGIQPETVVLWALVLAIGIAAVGAANAKAAFYDVVFCAGGNGSGNPTPGARPGFFDWRADCGAPPSYPADGNSSLQLSENTTGTAGEGDEVSLSWYAPPATSIVAGGGYTRMPNAFNQGWRARFWGEDWGGGVHNILLQGSGGIEGTGEFPWITKNTTSTFASHLWPYGGWDDYRRFVFGLACGRPGGCDRANFNAVDAHSITLVVDDRQAPQVAFEDAPIIRGEWVRGPQVFAWREFDQGSGLRFSRLGADGAVFADGTIDYGARGDCHIGYRDGGREFGKGFQPCFPGPWLRYYELGTQSLLDGGHTLSICLQDYGQYKNGADTCDRRTIRTDNTAPGKPASLQVTSTNPARYLDRFGATFSLPPNQGSPIAKVYYQVLNAAGEVLIARKTVSGTDPTSLAGIEGPKKPGAYTLRVWLEDSVGNTGPAADAAIPRDTIPPAAPQGLRVAGSVSRWQEKVDLRWRTLPDAGSPIDKAYYRVIDGAGQAVGPTRMLGGENVQAIDGLLTPAKRGDYAMQVWLSDAEGNVGSAASVPLPRDTVPPAAPQEVSVAPPGVARAAEGFDVRWRNIADDGSPIEAAHYEVLSPAGKVLVPETTMAGRETEAISELVSPRERGGATLRLWLSDAEGNAGAPVTVPLSYSCVRSEVGAAAKLTSAVAVGERTAAVLEQGSGAILRGRLASAHGGGVGDAALCVFSRVVTEAAPEFVGITLTNADGSYRFTVPAGPSRELTVAYRGGHRELTSAAQIATRVKPSFAVRRKVVRNKGVARFVGHIPGPDNDNVVVVLQVKRGDGWLAFRRYKSRDGGRFTVGYRFTRTDRPTLYLMRAQVRAQGGYPYLQGTSEPLRLIVLPARRGEH